MKQADLEREREIAALERRLSELVFERDRASRGQLNEYLRSVPAKNVVELDMRLRRRTGGDDDGNGNQAA